MRRNQVVAALGLAILALAWIKYAEHPTDRHLRTALLDTIRFLG